MHGSGERHTSDGKTRVACGNSLQNGSKDYGCPGPCCLGQRSEEESRPLSAATQEAGVHSRSEREHAV